MKKNTGIAAISLFVIIIILVIWGKEFVTFLSPGSYNNVDSMVETMMNKSATPGTAMVISKQGELEYKCYGYADLKNRKKVEEESLFEIGSTTKAFTALAVILLEEEGYIAGSDPVTDYISWFTPAYKEEPVNITIDQLLAHTSGIPSWSIRLIPEGFSDDMLEKTIHRISNIALDTYPGTNYQYATVNYDILALMIEEVTGEKYQDFVTEKILLPLGMTESYFSTGQEERTDQLTRGYKTFFGKSTEYDAPRYYGNIAAGYLVTNVREMGLWINAQLGIGNLPDQLSRAIKKSHEVNIETAGYEDDNRYYSYGWINNIERRIINHSGSNPNYSSQVIIDLDKKEAVFVLANLNSSVPTQIAYHTYENMNGRQMGKFSYDDFHIMLDLVFSVLAIIALVRLCFKIRKLFIRKVQTPGIKKEKDGKKVRTIMGLIIRIIVLVLLIIWPYLLNYNYYLAKVWMSNALFVWEGLAVTICVLSIISKLREVSVHKFLPFAFKTVTMVKK